MIEDKELKYTLITCEKNYVVASYTPFSDSNFFKGHFPDYPIVPGIILIELSLRIIAEVLLIKRCELKIKELKNLKFLKPVLPEETIEIKIRFEKKEINVDCNKSGNAVFKFTAICDESISYINF